MDVDLTICIVSYIVVLACSVSPIHTINIAIAYLGGLVVVVFRGSWMILPLCFRWLVFFIHHMLSSVTLLVAALLHTFFSLELLATRFPTPLLAFPDMVVLVTFLFLSSSFLFPSRSLAHVRLRRTTRSTTSRSHMDVELLSRPLLSRSLFLPPSVVSRFFNHFRFLASFLRASCV